jgi:hypothetical protein
MISETFHSSPVVCATSRKRNPPHLRIAKHSEEGIDELEATVQDISSGL